MGIDNEHEGQDGKLAQKLGELSSALAGALTPVGLAALGIDPGTAAVAGVGAAMAVRKGGDAVLRRLGSHVAHRWQEAGRDLFSEILALVEATDDPEEKRKIIEDYADDPDRDGTLLEGWKTMISAPDGAAWPALRRLTIQYWADGRSVDPFFRETSGLLTEATQADLSPLKTVLGFALAGWPDGRPCLELAEREKDERLLAYAPSEAEGKGYDHFDETSVPRHYPRILRMLKGHDFGVDQPTGRYGGGNPSKGIMFEAGRRTWLENLLSLLDMCSIETDQG